MQKRPINNHDYNSLSLEFAYAGNMRKNMQHKPIYAAYAPHISPNFAYLFAYFASKVSHILRKFSSIGPKPTFIARQSAYEIFSMKRKLCHFRRRTIYRASNLDGPSKCIIFYCTWYTDCLGGSSNAVARYVSFVQITAVCQLSRRTSVTISRG